MRKLVVLSFDGLSKVDMEKMRSLPNFGKFYENASGCTSVRSVYPSLTYCAHTSIATGVYPDRHGVINNTLVQPHRSSPDWYWYDRDIKVSTFQKTAAEAGNSILSIFWPVTAGARHIKYNMPEIFANRKWKNQILVSLKNGTPGFQMDLNRRFGKLRNGHREPELDNFIHESFLYSIKKYKADISMLHYIDLDSQRHEYGFSSKEADDALRRLDGRLGDIINALKEEGLYDDTVIVVLGDHSSIDGHTNVYINRTFEKAGLLKSARDKTVERYSAICKKADGAAYIYADKSVTDESILNAIDHLVKEGVIERVFTSEEAESYGADGNCRFMLEASRGYFFQDEVEREELIEVKKLIGTKPKICINNHGYHPDIKKDYETVFLASGKGIKKGVYIDSMNLVDEGPTFAKILGLEMKDIDGRVIDEILEV